MLSKLRYDESVSGYALITNDGQPFLSFSLPDEALPPIQGALRIHESSLRLMNIMTDAGTVILARVDPEWILGVLFEPTESLGSALQKIKDVARLLEDVTLPPPPAPIEHPIPVVSEVGTGTSASISPVVEENPQQVVMVKDEELIPQVEITKIETPSPRQAGKIIEGEPDEAARKLVELLHTEAKVI